MTFEQWVQLLIPIIAVVVAIISAALSYYFSKKQQILADERRLKERAYLDFIEALNHNVMDEDIDQARNCLSEARNKLLLIASAKVVFDLCNFTDYIAYDRGDLIQPDETNRLLTEVIKGMREDLYGTKNINVNYPTIALTGVRKEYKRS